MDRNYRSMGKFGKLAEKLDLSTEPFGTYNTPHPYGQEALRQDLDPRNFMLIDQEIARAKKPLQRQILWAERERLADLHRQMMEGAAASGRFSPERQQLFGSALTGAERAGFEGGVANPQFMEMLIQMMQRRHGRWPGVY